MANSYIRIQYNNENEELLSFQQYGWVSQIKCCTKEARQQKYLAIISVYIKVENMHDYIMTLHIRVMSPLEKAH
jgi:hypothetical protein